MNKLPKFKSKAFLAPMAGVTDAAFRALCAEHECGLVCTELNSIHAIIALEKQLKAQKKKITDFIEYSERERPHSVQLFGSDIKKTVAAAKIVEPYFDIIDFNMGCPAPHITSQMAGAALLEKPEHIKKLFTKLVEAVDKPVTLKLRTGINANSDQLWKPIAKAAEDAGVSMITLHARTIKQGYSGKANWEKIRELRSVVGEQVVVVGNGDINNPEDAKKMFEETCCNYVMIGRGAMGKPQIFEQVNSFLRTGGYSETRVSEQINSFFKYLEYTKEFKKIKFTDIRTQAMHFSKGIIGGPKLRVKIGKAKNISQIRKLFEYELNK